MIKVACDYNIKEDIGFILESEKINKMMSATKYMLTHIIINIGLIRLRKN